MLHEEEVPQGVVIKVVVLLPADLQGLHIQVVAGEEALQGLHIQAVAGDEVLQGRLAVAREVAVVEEGAKV